MKRFFLRSVQGRIITILLLFMTVSLIGTWFVVRYMSQQIISSEKSNKLLLTARLLDFQLGDRSYDDILIENGAENLPREEQIAVLSKVLSDLGDSLTEVYPDIGVGYYSLQHDAILTYAPSEQYKATIGVSIAQEHPGRIVMQNNEAMVRVGSMVRGNIMNAMQPLVRNGRVIGYTWANELTSSIEKEYRNISNGILIFMFVFYIFSIGMAVALSKRSMRDLENIIKGVRVLRYDLSCPIPKADGDLGEVIDSINAMAADMLKAEEDHKALLLAEAANLAQKDFLSRMSHEIRTPMNGVLGMTQLAKNAKTDTQRLEYLGKIHTSASLLLGIINDILDVSKIDAGKMQIEEQPFKPTDIIDNILDLITPRVDEKNLDLIISVDDSVPKTVVGDSLRVSQTLFNIVGNAVKFTLEGSISLNVSAKKVSESSLRLNFEVRDTGIGMDEEQKKVIFNSFIQADSSTARKFGGSGLGLSISRALVELMGGEIQVTSEVGKGSEFSFYVTVSEYKGDGILEIDEHVSVVQNQRYDGFSLLLVEDIEINQEIAKTILEDMGFKVDTADNGREGVGAAVRKHYDLIFMDIRMPVMDGIEATREIRRIERENISMSRVPIIAMTANAMQEDKDNARDAGMDGHISKPLDIGEIYKILYEKLIK